MVFDPFGGVYIAPMFPQPDRAPDVIQPAQAVYFPGTLITQPARLGQKTKFNDLPRQGQFFWRPSLSVAGMLDDGPDEFGSIPITEIRN